MPIEKEERGPFCVVCGEAVKTDEGYYRASLAWFHVDCYEKAEKVPRKHARSSGATGGR